MTFRLLPEDRQLLQDLGRGRADILDRYAALMELTDIVEEIDLSESQPERRSIRLGIPDELDAAIRKAQDRSGRTYISILLDAAREYRKRYPLTAQSD